MESATNDPAVDPVGELAERDPSTRVEKCSCSATLTHQARQEQEPDLCAEIAARLENITLGDYGVEEPHADYLSIVANPQAPTYEWVDIALVPEDVEDGITRTQAEANAAMFAAAPRLLRQALATLTHQAQTLAQIEQEIGSMEGYVALLETVDTMTARDIDSGVRSELLYRLKSMRDTLASLRRS